ncbi:ATP-binding cassette domain-containing protein [Bernardetia sp. ABR2-2B]|uniref:ATP-binding cassette domain-containing protein n=1 Tax=Bernardetia sp. ABR2-2B TaxID=3127472 RepID=UPI0030CD6A6F
MARDDFNADTKNRLAKRAGYQCSICKKLTISASEESNKSVNSTGVAAHISGASDGRGSRRYDPQISHEERKSIENGIWLCSEHANYIDRDEFKYSTEKLLSIKKEHEKQISLKHEGLDIKNGSLYEIEVNNICLFNSNIKIRLKKNNVFIGNNGTGKSTLCQIISSLENSKYLNLIKLKSKGQNGYFKLKFIKSVSSKYRVIVNSNSRIEYEVDEVETPILDSPVKTLYLEEKFMAYVNNSYDFKSITTAKKISKFFNLKKSELISLLYSIRNKRKYFIHDLEITNSKELEFKIKNSAPFLPLANLSGGESVKVCLEIILQLAIYFSKFRPTILLIEKGVIHSLDTDGIKYLMKIIVEENFLFQFIFVDYDKEMDYIYPDMNVLKFINENGVSSVKTIN